MQERSERQAGTGCTVQVSLPYRIWNARCPYQPQPRRRRPTSCSVFFTASSAPMSSKDTLISSGGMIWQEGRGGRVQAMRGAVE